MDFQKQENKELFARMVEEKKRMLGCSLEKAQMLVAALLIAPPKKK